MAGEIIIISGPVGAGKTTVLRAAGARIPEIAGFAALRVFEDEAKLIGYDLVEARTERRIPFLRAAADGRAAGSPGPDGRIGRFAVLPGAIETAAGLLRSSPPSALLAVDELGPAELEGRGHWPALRPLLDEPERSFLFVIRDSCLADFRGRLAPRPVRVVFIREPGESERAASEIAGHVHQG